MLWALLILIFVILLHEIGHWLVARFWKFPTPVLSVGFGPKLVKFRWKDMEWRFCLIPLGGYVEIPQLARKYRVAFQPAKPHEPVVAYVPLTTDDGTVLQAATGWQRITIAVAGPLVNLLIGAVLLTFLAKQTVPLPAALESSTVGFPIPGAFEYEPGTVGGIQAGDVLKQAGKNNPSGPNTDALPLSSVYLSGDEFSDMEFERTSEEGTERLKFKVKLSPAFGPKGESPLPILPQEPVIVKSVGPGAETIAARAGLKTRDRWISLGEAPVNCPSELASQLRKQAGQLVTGRLLRAGNEIPIEFTVPPVPEEKALADWFSFTVETQEQPQQMIKVRERSIAVLLAKVEERLPSGKDSGTQSAGMLGMAGIITNGEKHGGWAGILLAAAFINLGIMIFNLLPIPPLDGGRMLEGLVEVVMRRPLPAALILWKDMFGLGFIVTLLASMFIGDLWSAGHKAVHEISPVTAQSAPASDGLRNELKWLRSSEEALRGQGKGARE